MQLRKIASRIVGRRLYLSPGNAGTSLEFRGSEAGGSFRRWRPGTGGENLNLLPGGGISTSFPLCGPGGVGYVHLNALTGEGIFLPGIQSCEIEASSVKKKRRKKMNKHKLKKLRRRDRNSTKKNK